MIGGDALKQMKSSAFLVNVARGDVVDQQALIAALKDGTIAGVALDVTSPEPLPSESELWTLPNVILTPHMAGNGRLRAQGGGVFIANLRRYVAGDRWSTWRSRNWILTSNAIFQTRLPADLS
jgi:phosphoglycerate dehydrogenase-like enzyme